MNGMLLIALALLPAPNVPQEAPDASQVDLVFMVPDPEGPGAGPPLYRRVDEGAASARFHEWIENESADRALGLYALARAVMEQRGAPTVDVPYHVAVLPGGNHADSGFRLRTPDGIEEHPDLPYVKLGPEPQSFRTTFLHETGHVVLSILSGGQGIPAEPMASIPHTTAALTDRGTAFNEGFAIHLETLAAHFAQEPGLRSFYHHRGFEFSTDLRRSELLRPVMDLATYSQSRARYDAVRENQFAFASAFKGPDYLRVQLETARDMSQLRSANQLLQSEGFHATFFFCLTVRGASTPDPATVEERQRRMLWALAETFARFPLEADSPHLLHFIVAFLEEFPDQAAEAVEILTDLSHGVFVDERAEEFWRGLYLGALSLDLGVVRDPEILRRRKAWIAGILEDPSSAFSRLGPQIRCRLPARSVQLVALGQAVPVSFDLNTVQEGILRLVPGITEPELRAWLDERARQPFESLQDFEQRAPLGEECRRALEL